MSRHAHNSKMFANVWDINCGLANKYVIIETCSFDFSLHICIQYFNSSLWITCVSHSDTRTNQKQTGQKTKQKTRKNTQTSELVYKQFNHQTWNLNLTMDRCWAHWVCFWHQTRGNVLCISRMRSSLNTREIYYYKDSSR